MPLHNPQEAPRPKRKFRMAPLQPVVKHKRVASDAIVKMRLFIELSVEDTVSVFVGLQSVTIEN